MNGFLTQRRKGAKKTAVGQDNNVISQSFPTIKIVSVRKQKNKDTKKIRQILKILKICVLFSAFTYFPINVYAQETAVFDISIQPNAITVGDPILVQISVQHPAGSRVIPPQLNGTWGALEVLGQETAVITPNPNGTETSLLTLQLTAWETGEIPTPPLLLQISDAAGNITTITTDPLQITVLSVLPEGEEQTLRDLKPQATLIPPTNWLQFAGLGALALAALGIALLGARWLRQRPSAATPADLPDNRPPHEVALAALAELTQKRLPENGRFKPYYTELTDIIRLYLEAAFEVPAMDRTTGEIRRVLQQNAILPPELIQSLRDTLDEADLVKFAKVTPTTQTAAASMQRARDFIQLTSRQKEIG